MYLNQRSCGNPLPLDGFPVCLKCHCCPRHGMAAYHLSTDIVNKLFIMKPNGEKWSPLKQLLFWRLFFSLWQLCFLYRQAIMRNCVKSVWWELIWAPFICFPPSFFCPQTRTQTRARARKHAHADTQTRAHKTKGSRLSRTNCGWRACTRGPERRQGAEVDESCVCTQNKWNVIVVVSPR